jgi:hypothetical protein
MDYIDFENGVTEKEAMYYISFYYRAFKSYRHLLLEHIEAIGEPST